MDVNVITRFTQENSIVDGLGEYEALNMVFHCKSHLGLAHLKYMNNY